VPVYRKHLGIYAYRRDALLTLAAAPVCELERLEKLEQLRALYLGLPLLVLHTPTAPHGIDTPDDYAAFLKRLPAVPAAKPSP
jgi:3-deoxy-manno-octulosonate cytidylyltransferase (CMP-KDO synthetase)